MSTEATKSLLVYVTREPFVDFFMLHLPNGHTEELDVDDTLEWFKVRGADMDALEKALDHVWNFYKGAFEISDFKEPPVANPLLKPKI